MFIDSLLEICHQDRNILEFAFICHSFVWRFATVSALLSAYSRVLSCWIQSFWFCVLVFVVDSSLRDQWMLEMKLYDVAWLLLSAVVPMLRQALYVCYVNSASFHRTLTQWKIPFRFRWPLFSFFCCVWGLSVAFRLEQRQAPELHHGFVCSSSCYVSNASRMMVHFFSPFFLRFAVSFLPWKSTFHRLIGAI